MGFVVRVKFPPEVGNKMVKDPTLYQTWKTPSTDKAGAAYFMELNGERAAVFALDMPSVDMMPVLTQLLFMLGVKVELHPAMNIDDLEKSIHDMLK